MHLPGHCLGYKHILFLALALTQTYTVSDTKKCQPISLMQPFIFFLHPFRRVCEEPNSNTSKEETRCCFAIKDDDMSSCHFLSRPWFLSSPSQALNPNVTLSTCNAAGRKAAGPEEVLPVTAATQALEFHLSHTQLFGVKLNIFTPKGEIFQQNCGETKWNMFRNWSSLLTL